jgi:hypothetical protein
MYANVMQKTIDYLLPQVVCTIYGRKVGQIPFHIPHSTKGCIYGVPYKRLGLSYENYDVTRGACKIVVFDNKSCFIQRHGAMQFLVD